MAYEYDRFDDEGGGGGFMIGLIAGAVIGVGLGILLAPKAGSELRGQLGDQASRLRDRASEGYNAASHKVSNLYNKAASTGSTGSFAPGPSGTSGYATSGAETPVTNPEF